MVDVPIAISNTKKGKLGQFSWFALWMRTRPPPETSPEFGTLTVNWEGVHANSDFTTDQILVLSALHPHVKV